MNITQPPLTRVYTADIAALEEEAAFDAAYHAVSQTRREKTDKLCFRKGKCLSLGVELLLMRACRDAGVDYARERIVTDALSKPVFASCPLQFNLSHSGQRVMCALSAFPVGCDVEKTGPAGPEIANRFFHKDEILALNACETPEARADMFYRLWTLKESFIKCTGQGLRTPLSTFCVSLRPDGPILSQVEDAALYHLREFDRGDGYRYALCVRLPDDAASPVLWTHLDALLPLP